MNPPVKKFESSDLSFKGAASNLAKINAADYYSSRLQQVCKDLSKKDSKKAKELLENLPNILKKIMS